VPESNRLDLAKYRLEVALETCETASILLNSCKYKDSINRAYYSIFHALRAVLAIEAIDFKKHSAIIAYFRQHYIKTGIFDAKYSKMIGAAYMIRNQSDYEDFFIVSKADATMQYESAVEICEAVQKYLSPYLQVSS
jgi:uncharacterized protein (UPF0332 family)